MKTIVLKDYYYDDCLIVDEEWNELYDLDGKVKDFNEILDIFNKCNGYSFPLTHDNILFRNISVTDEELDKIAQRETRFGIIKTAIIWGWLQKEILTRSLTIEGIDGDALLDADATFNTVLNNIHYGRIKQACIAKEYPYEDESDVYELYNVPQILIDELNNHKRTK
jgi:hypothetical protein